MAFYLVVIAIAIGAFVYHLYNRNQIFVRLGIRGPKPSLLIGNWPLGMVDSHSSFLHQQFGKVYGQTYGMMEGGQPVLVTSNCDILHDVFNKKFANFHGRKRFPLSVDPANTSEDIGLLFADGARWKRQRGIINQCFSTGHIKGVYPMVSQRADVLIDLMKTKSNNGTNPIPIYDSFANFTVDVITKIVFDDPANYQVQTDNEYTRSLNSSLNAGHNFRTLVRWFPPLNSVIRNVVIYLATVSGQAGSALGFIQMMTDKLSERKKLNSLTTTSSKNDYLQYFIDTFDQDSTDMNSSNILTHSEKHLNTGEIVKNLNLLLFAGADTTASTLSFTILLLARHPDSQARLMEEVDEFMAKETSDEVPYELLEQLPYLDAVIKESLRAHNRYCTTATDVNCGNGKTIHIPAGMLVQADTWNLHKDKSLWGDDADEFKPERWTSSTRAHTHPMAYIPFGYGRRLCVGQRLASTEMKMVMMKLMKKFRFETCPDGQGEIVVGGVGALQPLNSMVRPVMRT